MGFGGAKGKGKGAGKVFGEQMPNGCSCFISFHRRDKVFVKNMVDQLKADDRYVWVDFENQPTTHTWLTNIHNGIESQDVFILVLSPDSIASENINWEIDHAVKNGKRIVPLVARDVNYTTVRKEIASLNWIFFRSENDDFKAAMKLLKKAIDTDIRHAFYHTQLLKHAIEWERNDFEKSYLLEGLDFTRAKHWLQASALGKEPRPTTLHLSYITASDSLNASMKKRRIIAVFFAFIVAIGIIWPDWGVFFFSLVFSHFFVYFSSN